MARPSGRRPGDSGTREAILAAARGQFAERGYDRTTIRSVAGEADVDPALVTYFFGSKRALFAHVIEPPVDLQDRLRAAIAGDPAELGERLARLMVGELEHPDGRTRLVALIRAAASEPAAAQRVREIFNATDIPVMTRSQGVRMTELGAALVSSQVMGIVLARYVVALEPLASASPEDIVRAIAPMLEVHLERDGTLS